MTEKKNVRNLMLLMYIQRRTSKKLLKVLIQKILLNSNSVMKGREFSKSNSLVPFLKALRNWAMAANSMYFSSSMRREARQRQTDVRVYVILMMLVILSSGQRGLTICFDSYMRFEEHIIRHHVRIFFNLRVQ